ncbi:cupin domain-containing protein [Streptomyces achromogenes]
MKFQALSVLVDDPSTFAAQLPTDPVVFVRDTKAISSLITLADMDQLVTTGGARRAGFTVARRSKPAPATAVTLTQYTTDEDVRDLADPLGVAAAVQSGYSFNLTNVQRFSDRLGRFTDRLSYEIGALVKAYTFLTPPHSEGTQHHDTGSNFICQTVGTKIWKMYRPALRNPLTRNSWSWAGITEEDRKRLIDGPPDLEITLDPGSVLWMPRGWIHVGSTTDDLSLHVSFRVETSTQHWLATTLVNWLADQQGFREDLTMKFDATEESAQAEVRRLIADLGKALESADLAEMARYAQSAHFSRFIGPRINAFSDIIAPNEQDLKSVRLRAEGAVGHLREGEILRVHLGSAERDFAGAEADLLEYLLEQEPEVNVLEIAQQRLGHELGADFVRSLLATGLAVRTARPW